MKTPTYHIIRGDRSGVFFGQITAREGREVTIKDARCCWYWDGAATILQLAEDGTRAPGHCKFTLTVPEITILDAIELVPCSEKAVASISGVEEWKR